MNNIFDDYFKRLLIHEGIAVTNYKEDPGKLTKIGITQQTLSEWLGRPASDDDVKNLTEDTAKQIYEKRYFIDTGIIDIPNPPQELMFDMAVNHGIKNCVVLVQRAINVSRINIDLRLDGSLGPMTKNAINQCLEKLGSKNTQNLIVEERIKFYNAIVQRNPSQVKFLRGWLNRANSFKIP